eukprot:SAG31_NODE_3267_length_4478_cov_2.996118_8_plen_104_part_00
MSPRAGTGVGASVSMTVLVGEVEASASGAPCSTACYARTKAAACATRRCDAVWREEEEEVDWVPERGSRAPAATSAAAAAAMSCGASRAGGGATGRLRRERAT